MAPLDRLSRGSVVPDITWRKQDWAYEQIREWIITGELVPGERIDQEQLASALGISRIPLREGLARLIVEGLLSGQPHRQLTISELSLADARDVYGGRRALESTLAEAAAQQTEGADLSAIQEALETQRGLLDAGTSDDFRKLDRRFHRAIYQLAAMPKTLAAANSLYSMSERYVRLYLADPERSRSSFEEHEAIFAAIKTGDAADAARLTSEHVAGGLSLLEERFLPPESPSA